MIEHNFPSLRAYRNSWTAPEKGWRKEEGVEKEGRAHVICSWHFILTQLCQMPFNHLLHVLLNDPPPSRPPTSAWSPFLLHCLALLWTLNTDTTNLFNNSHALPTSQCISIVILEWANLVFSTHFTFTYLKNDLLSFLMPSANFSLNLFDLLNSVVALFLALLNST